MTPERWQQVKFALDKILDSSPTQRPRMIESVCLDDAELRSEVESLLAFENAENGSFDKSNLSSVIQDIFSDETHGFIGKQIGKYTILREIGDGGMGTVYLAERADGEFEQQVAIKFLRRGFSSKSARQRFAQERQILARLHHRFIAQLVDGGTTDDGTPYLAMEYVEGVSITDYCRENNLSINEKLDLFRSVCEAVSFAHRNLIVHRDLKPDNILITADGVPKLLDFGIAKLLSNTEIKATVTHQQALTPEYAAPEQLAGRDITTASDVYALGIILYELLTGTHPFRHRGMSVEQIWKSVVLDEPLRPSAAVTRPDGKESASEENEENIADGARKSIRKTLRGDLDTIILKSLRKEPERRYDSVERFSQDIKFYLKGFPISARPDTFRYRAGKFFKRNPLASIVVSIAALGLMTGIFIAIYQARIANLERDRAEKRFEEARSLANSFMFEINDKIEESPIQARELLVSRTVQYLDALSQESGNDAALQTDLATSYEKIGNIQSELFKPNSGKTSDALVSHQKSLQIRQKLFDAAPQNVERGLDVVKSLQNISGVLSMSGRVGEARQDYTEAVNLCLKMLETNPNNLEVRRNLARSYARRGQSILRSGSLSETLDNYQKSLAIFQQLASENPNDPILKHQTAIVLSYIGYVHLQMKKIPQAVRYFEDCLNIEQKLAETDTSLKRSGFVSSAQLWYGIALSETGAMNEAISHIKKSLELQQVIYDSDRNNFGEQNALADCYIELAQVQFKDKQITVAIENAKKAIEFYQSVWQQDASNLTAHRQVAYSQRFLAVFLSETSDRQAALENYQVALKSMTDLTVSDPSNTEWKYDLALCYKSLGEFYLKNNNHAGAAENFRQAQPILQKLVQESPENEVIKQDFEKLRADLEKIS